MIKILLLFALGYFAWRAIKKISGDGGRIGASRKNDSPPAMDADMVQDPQCGVYVTREGSVRAEIDGRKLFFCSRECKEKYLAGRGAGK